MTRRSTVCGAIVVCLAAGTAMWAQQAPAPNAPPLTLQAARDRAETANPTIVAARLQRAVDLAGVGVAKERPNPDLLFEAARDTPKEALGLTVPIELGGKRQRRVDVAQATVSTSAAEVDQTVAEVLNDVRRAYFEAVAAGRLATLAEDTRALAVRARDAARNRLAAGDVAQADVARAELALAAADDEVMAAQGEGTATKIELNALLGLPAATPYSLADDLEAGAVPTLDSALTQATSSNQELQVFDRRLAEQAARVNLAKAQRTPDLSVGGGITFNAQPDFAVGWRANAGITLPLFTSHQAGVAVEEAELARLRGERDALIAAITGGVAAALARVTAARDRMTHFRAVTGPLVASAEQYAEDAYTGGQTPLSDLLQALHDGRDIQKSGVSAGLDFQMALADLERAIGAGGR